jgi:hypothetical protein
VVIVLFGCCAVRRDRGVAEIEVVGIGAFVKLFVRGGKGGNRTLSIALFVRHKKKVLHTITGYAMGDLRSMCDELMKHEVCKMVGRHGLAM